ncbi:MAG: hypothetical protein H6732_02215 [Alphaproteobacteria bacterium]|nr:hypothetical protein [Alphaproteobacteria bacterium]
MKLAPRLIAVTAGTVFVASAVAGGLLVRMEHAQLVADEITESRVLVRSLQVSVENALRDGQDPDIAELLGRLELVAGQVDVLVFSRGSDTPRQASLGSDLDDAAVQRVRELTLDSDEAEVYRVVDDEDGVPHLVSGTPLRTDGGERIGTLVVNRPLSELHADLRATTWLLAASVLAFAAVTTMVMLVFLRREVTVPLSRIAAATDRLGEDLDAELELAEAPSEELDLVRRTLLHLQGQLVRARNARAREASQRESLERQLREADKLIVVGQLAAGVAHEIGSPLQVMIGRARLLATDAGQSPEVRRQGGLIVEHAQRIAGIVERLQDVVRRRPARLRSVDLVQPVEKVMWLLEPEAKRRGVTLAWAPAAAPVTVRADPDEVQQVVLNLALNALQATPSGGRVEVRVVHEDSGGSIHVCDTGRGMDDATRARVFEPFFTTRADEGGTGLGLAVVKSIADRHRAHVDLASTPGRGSEVTMTWPRGEA